MSRAAASGVDDILGLVRDQLGMDVAFISERVGEERRFRNVSATAAEPISAGDRETYEGTYCQLISDGVIDGVITDVTEHPVARYARHTGLLGIGAYVGVPMWRADGRQYGTLCAYSHGADSSLRQRDANVLAAAASMIINLIEDEDETTSRRIQSVAAVERLVGADGLSVVFQPVHDLRSRTVVGLEALSRFDDGERPDRWFARARDVGRGVDLEVVALRHALRALELFDGDLHVNMSMAGLGSDALDRALAGVDLSRLVLDVSEHDRIRDYTAANAVLQPLRRHGARVSLDDTGSGYGSLRHLLQLQPDIVKLDPVLINGIAHDDRRQQFVDALADLATKIDALALAEGVEDVEDLEWVRELGIPLAQGFALDVPRLLRPPAG